MRAPLLPFVFVSLSTGAHPQARSYVSPALFAGRDAPWSGYAPLARPSPSRADRALHTLTVHDLPATLTGKLAGLAFRRDGWIAAGQPSPPFWVELEIAVSSARTTAKTISSMFAANEGRDRTVVVARKRIGFPRLPFMGKAGRAQPFFFWIPFDAGKTLVFKGGSLALDLKSYDNDLYDPSKKQYLDLYLDRARNSTECRTERTGRACYGSDAFNILPFHGDAYAILRPKTSRLWLFGKSEAGLRGGTGVMLVAAGLLPSAVSLPGDCRLYIDPATVFLAVPGVGIGPGHQPARTYYYPPYSGRLPPFLDLPWSSALRGTVWHIQMAGIDPKANSLGLTLTNRISITMSLYDPAGLPVSSVAAWGTAFTAKHGVIAEKHDAAMTRFIFQ